MKTVQTAYGPGTVPSPALEANWKTAQRKLQQLFPKVDPRLWEQLKMLTLYGERHRVPEDVDPMVHAYLLSQLFCLKVMSVINASCGVVPVHARLGCVGATSPVSITVEGLDQVDLRALEDDFHAHLARELRSAQMMVN